MSCNIINEYIKFKKMKYLEYTKLIMGKYYDKHLVSKYLNKYLNIRYLHNHIEVKSSLEANLNYYLNGLYNEEPSKVSKFILELFKMYYYLDEVKPFDYESDLVKYVEELNQIRIIKLGLKEEDFSKKLILSIRDELKRKDVFLDSFESEDFYLIAKKIVNKNVYDVTLEYNIKIPKLYSSYAINKVYTTGLIAENKIFVEYYILVSNMLRDIIDGLYNKHYLVDFPISILEKKEKVKKLLNIMNSDITKEYIHLKIYYKDFKENKNTIYECIKDGYQVAIIVDDEFMKDEVKSYELDIFSYIIINNKKYKYSELLDNKRLIEIN